MMACVRARVCVESETPAAGSQRDRSRSRPVLNAEPDRGPQKPSDIMIMLLSPPPTARPHHNGGGQGPGTGRSPDEDALRDSPRATEIKFTENKK